MIGDYGSPIENPYSKIENPIGVTVISKPNLTLILSLLALLFVSCGTFEVGVEEMIDPSQATTETDLESTPESSVATITATSTVMPSTPTAQPDPP